MARPIKALIDVEALRRNFALSLQKTGGNCMPMVKANGYGHGTEIVCRALGNADAFGVASIEEAMAIRSFGIMVPILLLEGTFSADEILIAEKYNFWLLIENHRQKHDLIKAPIKKALNIWLGIDTGLHRLGFDPREISSVYRDLMSSKKMKRTSVLASHFASADQPDNATIALQLEIFDDAYAKIEIPPDHHVGQSIANSAAILSLPTSYRNWQRPGYMLYGNSPFSHENLHEGLQPVMHFVSAVTSIRTINPGESVGYSATWTAKRKSIIATVSAGYGDGYPRHAPNNTPVLIGGKRQPLVGRVSMDMITVDVTDDPEIQIGDMVTLWGPDLPVNEIARICSTNGYELLSGITARVPRIAINQ
ncbi:MAG: alanine racemase [Cellvibrionales bacterium TMED49]|nr:alanine racemase [Porticoccaceae bacterium]OUU35562.1 MAG: alanine racemase [Cellvibrionales bacterium TMED49]|tara:strand:+ start:1367 stop:2461 length:1095 start_codon:yes stop_codon:yes gene_type:complete